MRGRCAVRLARLLGLLMFVAGVGSAETVKELRVENRGPGLADEQSVSAYTSLKPGDEFSRQALGRDIKALDKSGRFTSVSAEVEAVPGGVQVTYVVESKPRIDKLEIAGADYLGNKKVRELLELGVGDLVDDSILAVHAQKVKDTYHKKYFPEAELMWTIEPAAQPGLANVQVTVKEGKRANVKRIRFIGNRHVSSRELRKVMKQRPVNWLSFVTGAGTYSPDDLQMDLEALKKAYLDRGYLDASVKPPEISAYGRKGIRIVIPVDEGNVYRIGKITLSGVTLFPQDQVEGMVATSTGDIASMEKIEASGQAVRDFYGSRGHIRTVVDPGLDVNIEKSVADVKYAVTEGKLAYIRNVRIRGNSQTKDKVIRRELSVYPGEIFNEVKIRTSERRLQNLGYFSFVDSMPEDTSEPDRYDLDFEVEEQKTGQFMVGAGFSSVDDLIGFVELSQGNFDLLGWPRFTGGGQKLKLRSQFGTKRTDYELSFVEPWFLNRRLSLGVNLYEHDTRFLSDEYDQRKVGAGVTMGKPLGAFNRVNLGYNLEQIDVYNVSSNASETIRQEEGSRTKSSMTLELVHDTRDSVFIPSRGNRTTLSGTLAGGLLGAETDLYSLEARSSQYWPLWFDHVFNVRGWAAVVDSYGDSDRVPIFDRLFLGGARTIRGFKYRDVGPKDETGEPVGGQSAWSATAEYTMPLGEKIRFAAFYDVGMVWSNDYDFSFSDLNSSWGVGLRFDLPGFPIQLDYSWPIEADPWNDKAGGRFSFWMGYVY